MPQLRLLIVSPHFPPSNTPDMHRVRLILPFLRQNGWDAEVLAVDSEEIAAPLDRWLLDGIPAQTPVHRVHPIARSWAFVPGLGGLPWRAIGALLRAGNRLLSKHHFDLIYFSTTVFEIQVLGAYWKRRFGVPYVLDYQDPWVNDYYRLNPSVRPPGGHLKHAISSALNRVLEPITVGNSDGITSVSAGYVDDLQRRYKGLKKKILVQPFPGAARDFQRLHERVERSQVEPQRNGKQKQWLYVGRGGGDIARAVKAIFFALKHHAPESLRRELKVRFIGTSYAAGSKVNKTIAPIAHELGVSDIVEEHPERIPYSRTLDLLTKADALIIPASDDPEYTASKIYPYLLARRPLLVVCHDRGPLKSFLDLVGGAVCIGYSANDTIDEIAARINDRWLRDKQYESIVPIDEMAFRPYTDEKCAEQLATFFKTCRAN